CNGMVQVVAPEGWSFEAEPAIQSTGQSSAKDHPTSATNPLAPIANPSHRSPSVTSTKKNRESSKNNSERNESTPNEDKNGSANATKASAKKQTADTLAASVAAMSIGALSAISSPAGASSTSPLKIPNNQPSSVNSPS